MIQPRSAESAPLRVYRRCCKFTLMQLQTTYNSDPDHDAPYICDKALRQLIENGRVAHDVASNIDNSGPASISGSENHPWFIFSL
jgi:hypothetical protein